MVLLTWAWSKLDVEELDWLAKSPDLNPTEDLRDEIVGDQTFSSNMSDLTNALLRKMVKSFH